MDVYAKLNSEQSVTISHCLVVDVLRLFAYGRPLWGSHMATRSLDAVISLAEAKVSGDEREAALALLSFRIDFYVGEYSLAEKLVSGFLCNGGQVRRPR
jgi:hypothetical protein